MSIQEVVSIDPHVMSGTPVFPDTRVPVQSLIDHIIEGDGLDDFLQGFPTVTRQQAEAFLKFAFANVLIEAGHARAA